MFTESGGCPAPLHPGYVCNLSRCVFTEGARGVKSEGEISGVDDESFAEGFDSNEMIWMNHD